MVGHDASAPSTRQMRCVKWPPGGPSLGGCAQGQNMSRFITWLFADPEIAQEFADEFNGTMLLQTTIL
jgi:hypothetical protein